MKQFRTTGIFSVLALGFVAYVYVFEFQGGIEEEKAKEEAQKVLQFKKEDINKVKIIKGQNTIILEHVGDKKWNLIEPVKDKANGYTMNSMVEQLLKEKQEGVVAEGPDVKYKIYGLEPPLATLVFELKQGEPESIAVGSVSGLSGKKYIRKVGSDKVYLVGHSWESNVNKVASDLRDKEIFRTKSDDIVEFEIQNKLLGKDFKFKKEKRKWKMLGKFAEESDHKVIDSFVKGIVGLKANGFVSEEKTKTSVRTQYKLDRPQYVINWKMTDGKEFKALAGQTMDTKIFLEVSHRPTVFQINKAALDLSKKTFNDFRDKKAPFKFDTNKITAIDYKTDMVSMSLKKSKDKWDFVEKQKNKEVLGEKVKDLLSKLEKLEAKAFYGNNKKIGSAKGNIILKDNAGKTVFDLKWGRTKDDVYLARTNMHSEALGVESNKISELPGQTLVKSLNTKKEKSDKVPNTDTNK